MGIPAHVREATGGAHRKGLVDERVLEAASRDAVDTGADGKQRDEVADATGERPVDGLPGGIRCLDQRQPRAAVQDDRAAKRELRHREETDVRERVVDPPASETADDDDPVGAFAQGRPDRELGIGLVLVGIRALDGDARGFEARQGVFAERVTVADPPIDADAERAGQPRTSVRSDDEPDRRIPARPRRIELVPGGPIAVGQDEGIHSRDATCPAARLAAVPITTHPSVQRVLAAAERKGVTLDVVTFDESTHTAAEAAAAVGAELGQIVKSLVFVIPTNGTIEPVLCLVAGHNRVDLARLAAVLQAPDIRRATAKEARELTGYSIGGIPPIGFDRPIRVVMDPDLGRYPVVWAAAGLETTVFSVPPGTLRILADATVVPIAETATPKPPEVAEPARRA